MPKYFQRKTIFARCRLLDSLVCLMMMRPTLKS